MEMIKEIMINPVLQLTAGVSILTILILLFINALFSRKNLNRLAIKLDSILDKLQTKNLKVGKEIRNKLIVTCKLIVRELEKDDGVN